MKKIGSMTVFAAALALGATAHAGDVGGEHKSKTQMQPERGAAYGADTAAYEYGFNELDRDRDGFLSREEAREHETLASEWDSADADRDGKLSEAEFSAFEDNGESAGQEGK